MFKVKKKNRNGLLGFQSNGSFFRLLGFQNNGPSEQMGSPPTDWTQSFIWRSFQPPDECKFNIHCPFTSAVDSNFVSLVFGVGR